MRFTPFLALLALALPLMAQERQPLETPYTPFDFDNYRRTPLQARQTSPSWASRDNSDLQRALISGERGKNQDIATRAAALFPDPRTIPIRTEPEPLPSRNELTDEITVANHGETTKGQRDLLARGRVAEELNLSSMSDSEYELYATRWRAEQGETPPETGEGLLRPMPTLTNPKTGGPPHGYSVSQAGVGARAAPRDGQNPFDDVIRVFRLNQPVTKGNDPLPTPTGRLSTASAPLPTPAAEKGPDAADASAESAPTKP